MRYFSALSALLSAALVVSLAVATAGSSTTHPGENGLIAYYVERVMPNGLHQGDMCVVDPGTGRTGRLTHSLEDEFGPDWSPDGSRIAFHGRLLGEEASTAVVYVLDPVTGSRRNVTGPRKPPYFFGSGYGPSWLPNGREIAFGWSEGLAVIGADGTGRRTIWRTPGFPYGVNWSPDGRMVGVGVYADPGISSLWIVDPETKTARQVDPAVESVNWSPNMREFIHDRNGIVITDSRGQEIRRLTSSRDDAFATWSPDGRLIAFSRNGELFIAPTDGSGERPLLSTPGIRELDPSWQPRRSDWPGFGFRTPCTLLGTDRSQTLRGTSGADFAEARRGHDRVLLGGGDDIGKGGEGNDLLVGGPGNDILAGGIGRDRVSCGPGRDLVHASRVDTVARDCERILRAP